MSSDGTDRRRARRYAARIKVGFRSVDELVTAYTGDLSRGGLFVAAPQQLPVGTEVQLSLDLPDGGAPARIPARVAYVIDAETARAQQRSAGMGMEFLQKDAAPLASRISAFLAASVGSDAEEEEAPLHVLVVDDSSTYREAVAEALQSAGHRVTRAEHGLDALGKAMRDPPDVVLSDVTMPVMDGWQLLRLLRARDETRHIPIVFLTTLASERDRIRGYELGVDDYIGKPSAREEVIARVRRIVARGRREDARRDTSVMSGDLRQVSLPSLLAFAEAERRSGLLTLEGPQGRAEVGLHQGLVVSVEGAAVQAAAVEGAAVEGAAVQGAAVRGAAEPDAGTLFERLLRVLDREQGHFELSQEDVVAGDEAVRVQQALLEHARRKDEQAAGEPGDGWD